MDLKFASNMLRVTVGDGGREPTPASWGEKSGDSVGPGAAWSTSEVQTTLKTRKPPRVALLFWS